MLTSVQAPDRQTEKRRLVDTFGTHSRMSRHLNGQAVAPRYVLRERVSSRPFSHSGASLYFVDRTALRLTQIKQRLPQQFCPKWPYISPSRISIVGGGCYDPTSRSSPSNVKKKHSWSNESIKVHYTLRLEGTGFKHGVFLLRALRGQLINIWHSLAGR
jgi:hypothetical protein